MIARIVGTVGSVLANATGIGPITLAGSIAMTATMMVSRPLVDRDMDNDGVPNAYDNRPNNPYRR
jgi:hypothetical protein